MNRILAAIATAVVLVLNGNAQAQEQKIENSPSYKIANGKEASRSDFAPGRYFAVIEQPNSNKAWTIFALFDANFSPYIAICCGTRGNAVAKNSLRTRAGVISGNLYDKNGDPYSFSVNLSALRATVGRASAPLIDISHHCNYRGALRETINSLGLGGEVQQSCAPVASQFAEGFRNSIPDSFFGGGSGNLETTDRLFAIKQQTYVNYERYLREVELAEEQSKREEFETVERERLAAEREEERGRQEAAQSAEAERDRLAGLERQRAENTRLQAELKAVRELQRDRLAEAFNGRTQEEREAIQIRLFELGLYRSTVDGTIGTGTRAAIEEYARANNKIDLRTDEGAEAIITELAGLRPSTTDAVIVAPRGREPLDLSEQTNAQLYLDDIREFVALNPRELDALLLAGSYTPALQEVQNRDFYKGGSSFLKLVAYTRGSAPFREYHEAQNAKRFETEEAERTAIIEAIDGQVEALKARLTASPLAPDAFQLSQVIEKYQTIPKGADAETLREIQDSLETDLGRFKVSVASAPTSSSGDAEPTKASTADLEALSDVDANDIVILANVGKSAPHAFRNLSGDIAFEGNRLKVCAPSLGSLERQYRAFYEAEINNALAGHAIEIDQRCYEGLNGLDALIVTGADLAKSLDIPPADQLVAALSENTLVRLLTVRNGDFIRELAKREILSTQYENDIREGARVGFGLAFNSDAKVGCTVIDADLEGHDLSIKTALSALQFVNGADVKETANVSATVAFRQAQKGQCALIYASATTLKTILDASGTAGLSPSVLSVWTTAAAIAERTEELQTRKTDSLQSEAERLSELRQRQDEDEARRKTRAAQTEERQKRYRDQNGAKVNSLVSAIASQLTKVQDDIDNDVNASRNPENTVSDNSFWGPYPNWYADKRMSGWKFDSTVHTPKDYGIAKWDGREVEAVTAEIRVLMKHRELGKYSDTCWNIGYVIDAEFSMQRVPFAQRCEDVAALEEWQARVSYDTRWDLGVK